jgi:hypothetical protein
MKTPTSYDVGETIFWFPERPHTLLLFIIRVKRELKRVHRNECRYNERLKDLNVKTELLTGLLAGKQGWKCPVALLATCCGSKSLKVNLIDSDFRAYPVLNPLVTL